MHILFIIWAVLVTIVGALALTRKFAANEEFDSVYLSNPRIVDRQRSLARALDVIDRWGVTLTAVVLAFGLTLLIAYLYSGWTETEKLRLY